MLRKDEYWALEWDTMRSSHVHPDTLSGTKRGAWSKATGANATQSWVNEVARRREAKRIRAVKVRIVKVEDEHQS